MFWGYEKAHFFHLYRVGSPDLSRAKATLFTVFCVSDRTTRKWHPTPLLLPGESQGWGAWWAAVYGVAQSRTRLKRLGSSGPDGRASVYNVGDLGSIPGSGRCLQNPRDGEPGGLPSMGLHRVRHDLAAVAAAATFHLTH